MLQTDALATLRRMLDDAYEYRAGDPSGCGDCSAAREAGFEQCEDHEEDGQIAAEYVALVERLELALADCRSIDDDGSHTIYVVPDREGSTEGAYAFVREEDAEDYREASRSEYDVERWAVCGAVKAAEVIAEGRDSQGDDDA